MLFQLLNRHYCGCPSIQNPLCLPNQKHDIRRETNGTTFGVNHIDCNHTRVYPFHHIRPCRVSLARKLSPGEQLVASAVMRVDLLFLSSRPGRSIRGKRIMRDKARSLRLAFLGACRETRRRARVCKVARAKFVYRRRMTRMDLYPFPDWIASSEVSLDGCFPRIKGARAQIRGKDSSRFDEISPNRTFRFFDEDVFLEIRRRKYLRACDC